MTVWTEYEPTPVKQGDGSALQWSNCTCASGACALDRDSKGHHKTSGARVRQLTGDTVGGTTLPQVDSALRHGWPPDDHLDVRLMMPFDDAAHEVASGRGAELQIGYIAFANTALDGSPGFRGNHCIWWNAVKLRMTPGGNIDYENSIARIYDTLWDGRRPGIPSQQYRDVKLSVLRRAAAYLVIDPSTSRTVPFGYCYVAFTRDTEPAAPKPPDLPIPMGRNLMITASGIQIQSSHVMALKKGQPLYREPRSGSAIVTRMADAGKVHYFGYAGNGYRTVRVVTANFADHKKRTVLLYVPTAAGPITAR